jgi:hypothetical protein
VNNTHRRERGEKYTLLQYWFEEILPTWEKYSPLGGKHY